MHAVLEKYFNASGLPRRRFVAGEDRLINRPALGLILKRSSRRPPGYLTSIAPPRLSPFHSGR